MKKKSLWIALVLLLAAGSAALFYFYGRQGGTTPQSGRPNMDGGRPIPVLAAVARRGDIDVVLNALGTVTARNTVTVKPRVDGQLVRVPFREGQLVKAGEVLAEIDPRPLRVLLDQASGQLLRDQALLANAQLDLKRYRGMLAKESIARQQFDTQEALVRQYQGTVQTDQAQVDSARLQLDFTRITAPLSGRLGLRQIDVGNMVHASDTTGLVVITQTQPIAVVFAIPADSLAAVASRLLAGETLPVDVWDRDGKTRLAAGKLLTVDNQIDTTTGTVKLKAEFANADNTLFPNQFVNARLRVETRSGATLVPVAAIQRGTQGTFVYVINDADKSVSLRPVTLGPTTADTVAIENGLAVGEQVVVDGADKLRQGAKVEVATPEGRQFGRKGPPNGEARDESMRRRGDNPGGLGGVPAASGGGATSAGAKASE
jgi:multidrug efflux system membrane fusion protein